MEAQTVYKSKVSTGLMPIIKTNYKFKKEGIDAKFSLVDADKTHLRNLNKVRQVLSIFHNFHNMKMDKPRVINSLIGITRVKELTKGISSHEWIIQELAQSKHAYSNLIGYSSTGLTLPYNLVDEETQLVPYIIFKYLVTQLESESLNVYYELTAEKLGDINPDQVIISIITKDYVFKIEANNYMKNTTAGVVEIVPANGNREIICQLVPHPLEIIKTAISKTSHWYQAIEMMIEYDKLELGENKEEEYNEWFNYTESGDKRNLINLFREITEGKEGMRLEIDAYGRRAVKVLKALYSHTIANPDSFKTIDNCIGFRWAIEMQGEKYNLIIDRDFRYIYTWKKGEAWH